MRRAAAIALALAAGTAAAQDDELPPPIRAARDADVAACTAAGGTGTATEWYFDRGDLNGDGDIDYLIDRAGLACAGAKSALCHAGGCPVSVWLSGPEGLTLAWSRVGRDPRIDSVDGHPVVLVTLPGPGCTPPRSGPCGATLDFSPGAARPPTLAPAAAAEGWTLRAVPGASPVATSPGPGRLQDLALFCLSGAPWLAVTFRTPPSAETAKLAFAFADRQFAASARREPTAGGAYVVALAGQPLAGLLAGRDRSVTVSVDGKAEGELTLAGSSKAIRGALASCAKP